MKARPVIARARLRAAFRIGLRAYAKAIQQVAPLLAAAIEASKLKRLPFAAGGLIGERGEEFLFSRSRQLPIIPTEASRPIQCLPPLDIEKLRASIASIIAKK